MFCFPLHRAQIYLGYKAKRGPTNKHCKLIYNFIWICLFISLCPPPHPHIYVRQMKMCAFDDRTSQAIAERKNCQLKSPLCRLLLNFIFIQPRDRECKMWNVKKCNFLSTADSSSAVKTPFLTHPKNVWILSHVKDEEGFVNSFSLCCPLNPFQGS